jgi:type I restriction enzyme M protein
MLQKTLADHLSSLGDWWAVARDDFSLLREGKKLPEVRQELLSAIKSQLVPLGVLDEFKSAGVFVNWWQEIRYDLKTVISIGWHHTLVPDEYLIAEFFKSEQTAIDAVEAQLAEAQADLEEAVTTAQQVAAYEPDEDESVTAASIRSNLRDLIADLEGNASESARREMARLQAHEDALFAIEKRIRGCKADLRTLTDALAHKLLLKRFGAGDFTSESKTLLAQVEGRLTSLDPAKKENKKTIAALEKDKAALLSRIAQTDALLAGMGGQLTDGHAKTLILRKLYDLAASQLTRYLNAEKRALIAAVENFWDKYATSKRVLEQRRTDANQTLDDLLNALGYVQ